ncbi:hypothetical protein [Paraflavitalea pollutisoli]|uniref:hypothetical protein n=1 Tax=Paraflavitalea pollutisoli TaxID=3034143 RepID=UPI0023EB3207|nr:hypothetical protein [Paraflavitalea sp. H1-2-19X]
MRKIFFLFTFIYSTISCWAQSSIPSIDGWKMQEQQGVYNFIPTSNAGKPFIYQLMPLRAVSGDGSAAWFKTIMNQDAQQAGFTQPADDKATINVLQGFYSFTNQVSDKEGKKWLVAYMTYRLEDGKYRLARMVSYPDAAFFKATIQPAIVHFGKVAKGDGVVFKGADNGKGNTAASNESSSDKSTGRSTPRLKAEDFLTDNGLKPAQIKGMIMHLEYTMSGVGGMMVAEYAPYLLLTDGTIYNDPIISPYKFDVAKSRQLEPKKWGTWKEVGKTIVTAWPNKEREKDKAETWEKQWFWARPAAPNEKIKGSYKTISGGGNTAMGGNVMIISATDLTFNEQGQFTKASVGGGSNSGDFGVSSSTYAHKEAAGTYTLNGYSLELKYNNGKVESKSFYFYPDSKEAFGVGSSPYVPKGKKSK